MMNTSVMKGVKTSLVFILIAGCLFSSGCTALEKAQQQREARLAKKREGSVSSVSIEWTKSISEGIKAASLASKPVMMDFYTDW